MDHPTHEIDWRADRVPVSRRFDDPFFSLENGLAETRHVFLSGNDLPARFRPGFHIAELGFGTGLNLVAAALAWEAGGVAGPLRFTSFEAFPPVGRRMRARPLRPSPEAAPFAEAIAAALDGDGRIGNADPFGPHRLRRRTRNPARMGGQGRCLVSGRLRAGAEPRTVGTRADESGLGPYRAGRHLRDLFGGRARCARP